MRTRGGVVVLCVVVAATACKGGEKPLVGRAQTFAELRTVKRGVTVALPGEPARAPYGRERLVDGERIELVDGALAWLRRDGGATHLIAGPASIVLGADSLEVKRGRVFVDTPAGKPTDLGTPRGKLRLSAVRTSIDVAADGTVSAYVLRGAVRSDAMQASAGERLTLTAQGKAEKSSVLSWEDWTGGLATMDRAPEPAPYGVGTIGARRAGDRGQPRMPLSIQRMDVRVTIDDELATTDVEEVFANPTGETLEGLYGFRVPEGATLHRFGVDRGGEMVWGRVKEQQAALQQYESHVYQGSTEDPALLSWDSPGVYKARLYPVRPRETRRIVTRYAEWLGRQGPRGERRLYVYPMAAEGAEASLPRIEELTIALDLSRARAREVRVGMEGKQSGSKVTVKAYDFVPRSDFAVELYDDVGERFVGYTAPHTIDRDTTPADQLDKARAVARGEAAYVLVPVRPSRANEPEGGLDLAVVVDTSAATDPSALSIARATTGALLAHMGPNDRAAVWAGDATLRPVAEGSGALGVVDGPRRAAVAEGLAQIERGGATDLGAIVTEAASKLDGKRRSVVVYIGDGLPTVGERALGALRERFRRLPETTRLYGIGIGDVANLALLEGIARGGFAERVGDAYAAGLVALRVIESAERPVWLGATVDLGPGVDRVFPRELGTLVADESRLVVGRVVGALPQKITIRGSGGEVSRPLAVRKVEDDGDLRRRWAEGRLRQLLDDGAGRAAVVEVGVQSGVITPFTSLYVPTAAERAQELRGATEQVAGGESWWQWLFPRSSARNDPVVASYEAEMEEADNKEGGTGTRAKGEEGSMGKASAAPGRRYAVQGPRDDEDPHIARQSALREAMEFGAIGLFAPGAAGAPPPAPPPAAEPALPAAPAVAKPADVGDAVGEALGAGGLGLSGGGEGAGGSILGALGSMSHGTGTAKGQVSIGTPRIDFGEDSKAKVAASANAVEQRASMVVGAIGHAPTPCPPSSELPFEERRILWRERFGGVGSNVSRVVAIYRDALSWCEAPTWRERSQLLIIAVESLVSVADRVELWQKLMQNRAASDVIYRAILTRVQTAEQIRELHAALGIQTMDRSILARVLAEKKTPDERAKLLRGLVERWTDDLDLALDLLHALEDAGDDAGGRALARRLRRRSDATTRLRTAIGEYYLRLAGRSRETADRDAIEARRTFGEIVEFAPDDPHARRLLGDLLRAHGWYEEALRQYESLAQLLPDDTAVPLLRAAAAEGLGRTEEAVKWTEKAATLGSPEPTSPAARTARSFASAFLAWARMDASRAGRKDEADRLRERARRLTAIDLGEAGAARFVLTWAHPELRPELWSSALGAPMPAGDGDPSLGIAQTVVPASRMSDGVEIRLAPEDAERAARLGAAATLTAIVGEGTDAETIASLPVGFGRVGGVVVVRRAFKLQGGELREEAP